MIMKSKLVGALKRKTLMNRLNLGEDLILEADTQDLQATNATSKGFILTSAFWMMVATFYGLLGATELMAPDLAANMGGIVSSAGCGPTHVNLVLFGFVTPGLLGCSILLFSAVVAQRGCTVKNWG